MGNQLTGKFLARLDVSTTSLHCRFFMSEQESEDQRRTDGWKRLLIALNDLSESKKHLESYIAFADSPAYSEAYGAVGLEMAQTMENALLSYGLISYARPFIDSRGGKWTRVPGRFLSSLTSEAREIHDYVLEVRNKLVAHSDFEGVHTRSTHTENGAEILSIRPTPIVMIEGGDDSLSIDSAAERWGMHAEKTAKNIQEIVQDVDTDLSEFTLLIREDRMFEIDVEHCKILTSMINKIDGSIRDKLYISRDNL